MTDQTIEGFDTAAVEAWIAEHVPSLPAPLKWTRLVGGHSNLTYRLDGPNGEQAVIRRPPMGKLLPKAHDMSREWSVISSLGPTPVPVPAALGFCDDPSITGASFYIMELVSGRPLYNSDDVVKWVPEDRREALAFSFIDVLADLHSVAPNEVGLSELGKTDNYVERQLKTWYRSWTASIEPAQLDDPRAHDLQTYFLSHIPDQGPARIVHGDYGLHNCLTGDQQTITAVLDWEISTLGDPLADLAYALNPWSDPSDSVTIVADSATRAPGMPTRSELAARYADRTGRDLNQLDYYSGFNYWKSAAIMHGVYARYIAGQKSSEGVDLELWRQRISDCLSASEAAVQRHKRR